MRNETNDRAERAFAQKEKGARSLGEHLNEFDAVLRTLRHELAATLSPEALEQLDLRIRELHRHRERVDAIVAELREQCAQMQDEADRARCEMAAAQCSAETARKEVQLQGRNVADLPTAVNAYESSTTWKMTRPLRAVAVRWPWTARHGRRVLKLVWLASTAPFDYILWFSRSFVYQRAPNGPSQSHPFGLSSGAISAPRTGRRQDAFDGARPVAVIIDRTYPRADRDSGSVDAVNLVKIFRRLGYQVAFMADAEFSASSPYRMPLEAIGAVCISRPWYRSVGQFLRSMGGQVDVCVLSRMHAGGRFIEQVRRRCPRAKVIFNTVDLHHLREEREARLKGDRRALGIASDMRERELAITRQADATIVVSSAEAQLLREAVPEAAIHTVPLIRESPGRSSGFGQRRSVGFIGGYLHKPNIDAVHYFLDEIWPQIYRQLPEAKFLAMGADMPAQIKTRHEPGFVPVGYVQDLAWQLDRIRVMVAPLRFGAGAKGKIVSSLAHGVPCVASPVAAEGMGLIDGETVLIGDTPDAFAAQVIRLYKDELLWTRLSDAGIARMAEEHSLAAGERRIERILSAIGAPLPLAAS